MKIAVVLLTRGNVSGGARKHLRRVIPLLRTQPEVERVEVFVPPQIAEGDQHTWPERDELRGFRELRRALMEMKPDVVFIPSARLLRVPGVPLVTMIRNMEPLEVPFGGNTIKEGMKNVARAVAARAACRGADRIIAVSQHVRGFLVDRWRIPEARIGTVYHGIDPANDGALTTPPPLGPLEGTQFLFTAGSIRPARGLEDVIAALPYTPAGVRLVIAGAVDRGAEGYASRMRGLAERHGVASRVVWAGQLDSAAMSWCFRHAALFVMTSRAEACPNTVLEAMAEGAVSVSNDHGPMPEFYADAAVYYRQRDVADLSRKLREALSFNEDRRARLRERAVARSRHFTWEETARSTLAELRCAMAP